MGTTLYLLRQSPDRISSSIFQSNDIDKDIVFVEQAASLVPASVKGSVVVDDGMAGEQAYPTVTYDDLIDKIFSYEHVIVV
jgi:hypothetical protein